MGAEAERLADADNEDRWRAWGPFVSCRQWGTVREDYSADGDAWRSITHDMARSYTYRWGEDGLAAICDRRQGLCLGLALWNGQDPILKERLFGLGGKEGNHGEDVKEAWWYVDATPTHSWLRWRYLYPQVPFPYAELVRENAARGYDDPEYELVDTGVLDGAVWDIEVAYAKAAPDDICMVITARNTGAAPATLHVLPTLWFRNVWRWGRGKPRPILWDVGDGVVVADHQVLGRWVAASTAAGDGSSTVLACENEPNVARLYRTAPVTPYPKDGIGDHVVAGAATVNPDGVGTKAAWWHAVEVGAGGTTEVRVRLARAGDAAGVRPARPPLRPDLGRGMDQVVAARRAEADEFYAERIPAACTPGERSVARQAFAGLLWSQQFYRYDVAAWLEGDPAGPPPPPGRGLVRNGRWAHLDANDVISVPDPWEYPWFASWDLAFHCVALAHVDPALAKSQLLLLCREWYMHPDGQLPAYEWEFSDANPPVHAWAAMRVFEIDGRRDRGFLERVFHKLLINFTWWVNRLDAEGNNAFEGGFLGLDNIGAFNRSEHLPVEGVLEQSDGTGWMAMYCLDLLSIALHLGVEDPVYEDVATKFLEHFALIATAMDETGLWSEDDGFFYDVVRLASGQVVPLRIRSMVGVVPLLALAVGRRDVIADAMPDFAARARWFIDHRPRYAPVVGRFTENDDDPRWLASVVSPERLVRVLEPVLDESQFLSRGGLRSLSRWHLDHPVTVDLAGTTAEVRYEPGESRSGLFGGNSNWRGPVWFPVNFLVIEALRRYHRFLGDGFTVTCPTGSGRRCSLDEVADLLAERLVSLFVSGSDGTRPVDGGRRPLAVDPELGPLVWFHEYFDGDTGAGLGASHQTGWTALVADLVIERARRGISRGDGPGV